MEIFSSYITVYSKESYKGTYILQTSSKIDVEEKMYTITTKYAIKSMG